MSINNLKFGKLTGKIISAAIEVHRSLGPGFIESVYQNALKNELELRQLDFEEEKQIEILYKNTQVGLHRMDLVVKGEVVVELKAVEEISKVHIAQAISYLKATNLKIGLILNFAKSKIDIRRVLLDDILIRKIITSN
jgi:GxxExxY protein